MKVTKEEKKEFFRRKEVLENARVELKKGFVGLDDIIDEVITLIEPWYLFPNGQIRPTIVNLWGMTGVGKTSLIKRMFELINLQDSLYKFDVGDYASQDNTKLAYSFSDKLKNRERQQIGIIFDEFQLGRTIDENGHELEKSGLRAMWDLLDSGKISILQSSFYGTRIFQLSLKLQECIQNGDVEAKNGLVTKNQSYHDKFFKSEEEDDVTPATKKSKKDKKEEEKEENLFVPEDFHWYIRNIWEYRFISDREVKEHLKTLDHNGTVDFLDETMNKAFRPVEFDYSTSCIFVIGNIDEAYQMAKNFDPDSDADRFYKHSLNITLPRIKGALKNRFRAEQIARLGNSHIIYPAFSSKVYRELISLELEKVRAKVNTRFGIDINFHKSVNEIIYKEGVFPTQGARPVFTTISAIIEPFVGNIVKDILEKNVEATNIVWSFKNKKHIVKFFDKDCNTLFSSKYGVKLKIESLRESEGSELQAQVAIHEAGHAVAAIGGANVLPIEIVSRTANLSEGHCAVEIPSTPIETKDWYRQRIIISLGGHVAEELIFGEKNISNGTSGDFETASQLALDMAKTFGMLGTAPMLYGHKNINTNTTWNSDTDSVNQADRLAENIIIQCKEECKEILVKNKFLLLKIGEYLSMKSRMDTKLIQKFVDEYGVDITIKPEKEIITFKKIIQEKLDEESSVFRPKPGVANRILQTTK